MQQPPQIAHEFPASQRQDGERLNSLVFHLPKKPLRTRN
jgi:hypothetical protein